jgi:hypothetical protein
LFDYKKKFNKSRGKSMALTAEDKQEIMDLCARYYISTDEKDVDGFMDCWVDGDIRFESIFGDFTDHQSLRDFEDEHVHRGGAVGKRHLLGNVHVRDGEDDQTAFVTSYMIVFEVDEIPSIVATGIYRDSRVEKTPKGWKFRHRKLEVDPGFQKLMQRQKTQA